VKSRRGIPCIHIWIIVERGHSSMFHPRYYKAYNSQRISYKENIEMRDIITSLLDQHHRNPSYCDVSSHFKPPTYNGVMFGPGVTEAYYKNMIALEKMHAEKQCYP